MSCLGLERCSDLYVFQLSLAALATLCLAALWWVVVPFQNWEKSDFWQLRWPHVWLHSWPREWPHEWPYSILLTKIVISWQFRTLAIFWWNNWAQFDSWSLLKDWGGLHFAFGADEVWPSWSEMQTVFHGDDEAGLPRCSCQMLQTHRTPSAKRDWVGIENLHSREEGCLGLDNEHCTMHIPAHLIFVNFLRYCILKPENFKLKIA